MKHISLILRFCGKRLEKNRVDLDWNFYTYKDWDKRDRYFSSVDKNWLFDTVCNLKNNFCNPKVTKLYYKTISDPKIFIIAAKRRWLEIAYEIRKQPINVFKIVKKYFCRWIYDLLTFIRGPLL